MIEHEDVTRNDRMFLQVSKERAELERKLSQYRQVTAIYNNLAGGLFRSRTTIGTMRFTNSIVVDANTPAVIRRISTLIDGLLAEEDNVDGDVQGLTDRIERLTLLIEAYHAGEDILLAKLAL
jgi:hypothetical protein